MTHQLITFTATLDIECDPVDWDLASREVRQALLDGDGHGEPWSLTLVRVTAMKIVSSEG
jgi:hypothetical protein